MQLEQDQANDAAREESPIQLTPAKSRKQGTDDKSTQKTLVEQALGLFLGWFRRLGPVEKACHGAEVLTPES